ncbi:unnamed protein product [Callosobruchus maculatus]|uniref:Uncharacterized protein n=1 Tax=Callosobruchus maculatus TaxID=64391 RepID=A0A653BXU6_CALMS|nr:unnamed protein product [Callosobruchus maculatus]
MSKTASKKEENEMLIELVKNYRLLYDPNDVNFTNRIERHRCWEKISENVDMAVPECKKRWRSLRDQYNKKRREYGLASSTNWKYETQMSFLLEFMTDRRYHHLYTMSCKTRRSRRIHGKMTETNILIKICKWQNPKIGELNRQRPGGQEKTYDL